VNIAQFIIKIKKMKFQIPDFYYFKHFHAFKFFFRKIDRCNFLKFKVKYISFKCRIE